MTLTEGKFAVLALAALTLSVGTNLLLQQKPLGTKVETSALGTRISDQDLGLGSATRVVQEDSSAINAAEIVRGVQRELNARGYEAGQPDGVAGLQTRAAILAYEFDYGLKLTATPDQDLLSSIILGTSNAGGARPAAPLEVTREASAVIEMVEQALTASGYQTGKEKGTFSAQTARAIREFELDQKLPESGRISGPLMSRLLKLQSGAQPPVAAAKAAEPKTAATVPDPSTAKVEPLKVAKPQPRAAVEAKAKSAKAEKTAKTEYSSALSRKER